MEVSIRLIFKEHSTRLLHGFEHHCSSRDGFASGTMEYPASFPAQQQIAIPSGLMSPCTLRLQPDRTYTLVSFTRQTFMQIAQHLRDASQASMGADCGMSASSCFHTGLEVVCSTRNQGLTAAKTPCAHCEYALTASRHLSASCSPAARIWSTQPCPSAHDAMLFKPT